MDADGRSVPLVDVWARDGLASVTFASLQDAGFHPAIECDPRGWMHFYGWPLGSSRPITIWIPADELAEASSFLCSPAELPWEGGEDGIDRFVSSTSIGRPLVYLGWLLGQFLGITGFFILLGWALAARVPLPDHGGETGE